jgi:FKBP12-rapamycin complex-associated protein
MVNCCFCYQSVLIFFSFGLWQQSSELKDQEELYTQAKDYIERGRKCLATELAALVLESYDRAYSNMVRVQQFSELEEVIDYLTLLPVQKPRAELIKKMWRDRMHGTKRKVEVWQSILAVRMLVLPPTEDVDTWLKFASLCRKSMRDRQAHSTLVKLLQYDPEIKGLSAAAQSTSAPPQVMLAYLKYQWSLADDYKRKEAFHHLQVWTQEPMFS